MGLPSTALYLDKDNNEICRFRINVGWVMNTESLVGELLRGPIVKDCVNIQAYGYVIPYQYMIDMTQTSIPFNDRKKALEYKIGTIIGDRDVEVKCSKSKNIEHDYGGYHEVDAQCVNMSVVNNLVNSGGF